jgi:hypothetical protein
MAPKAKSTSSKPLFRWPWAKERKNDQNVDQQPQEQGLTQQADLDKQQIKAGLIGQAPTGPAQISASQAVALDTSTASSAEEGRLEFPTNVTSSTPNLVEGTISSAGAPSSFFQNASNFVVKRLHVDASQHVSNSNEPSGALPSTIPIPLSA